MQNVLRDIYGYVVSAEIGGKTHFLTPALTWTAPEKPERRHVLGDEMLGEIVFLIHTKSWSSNIKFPQKFYRAKWNFFSGVEKLDPEIPFYATNQDAQELSLSP